MRDQADHLRDLPTRALLLDAEERRLATTSKNARTTAVDLAVADGVPVEASLAARHPGAARTDPVLTEALLEHWVQEQPLAAAARLSA